VDAEYLSWLGRFDQALAESEKARLLDPLSIIIAADHAVILYYARQYDRALAQARVVLNMDPNATRAFSAAINSCVQQQKFVEAQALIDQHSAILNNPWVAVHEAVIYGHSGRSAEAQQMLTRVEQFPWTPEQRVLALLVAYSATDHKDQTIILLQQAVARHSNAITSMKVDPMYDSLRSDPRFLQVLHRAGLADSAATAKP
jgi:adenylate cyclase